MKSMQLPSWKAVDAESERTPRYPSIYFSGEAAKAIKPASVNLGGTYTLVARVKLTGVEEHDGELQDSISFDVVEAEIAGDGMSDAERAGKIYTSSK